MCLSLKKVTRVTVSGFSKGKGFQGELRDGVLGEHWLRMELSITKRKIGSVGSAFPQRVIKGRKMPEEWGADSSNGKRSKIIKIDADKKHYGDKRSYSRCQRNSP